MNRRKGSQQSQIRHQPVTTAEQALPKHRAVPGAGSARGISPIAARLRSSPGLPGQRACPDVQRCLVYTHTPAMLIAAPGVAWLLELQPHRPSG